MAACANSVAKGRGRPRPGGVHIVRVLNQLESAVVAHATVLGLRVTVPPTLRPGSRILFCGEAPGEDEEDEGEGFVGKAGQLLWKMAGAAGISREDVSWSNVV